MRVELRRDTIGFALATLLHLGVFSVIRDMPLANGRSAVENASMSAAEPVQEVVVDLDHGAEAETAREELANATTARTEGIPNARAAARASNEPAPRDTASNDVAAPSPTGAASGESASLLFTVPSLGLEGTNRFPTATPGPNERPGAPFANAAPRALSSADAALAATKTLRDGLRERDQEVGLGVEGPLVASLIDATHESLAAEHGRATFLAIVDAQGLVELRLLRSVGDGWDDARKRAARALAKKPIPLRGAGRAELEIEVVSDVRLPSGAKAPVTPVHEKSHVARSENVPGGTPDVVETHTVARFDVADVRARGTRIVHTRLVRATFF
jgi:hypothetical protein